MKFHKVMTKCGAPLFCIPDAARTGIASAVWSTSGHAMSVRTNMEQYMPTNMVFQGNDRLSTCN